MLSVFEIDDLIKKIGWTIFICTLFFILLEIIQYGTTIKTETITCKSGEYHCELTTTTKFNKVSHTRLPSPGYIKDVKIINSSRFLIRSHSRYSYTRHSDVYWEFKKKNGYYIYYVAKNGKTKKLLKTWFRDMEDADNVKNKLETLFKEDKRPIIYKI